MACGTPVITANGGGLSVVVGDAAVLVSSTNAQSFADAIMQILSPSQLRRTMVQKGLERTRMFSWEHCARETLKVYEELV